jgi:peptidoglycan/LPS O-acetylase OafA/YrhL
MRAFAAFAVVLIHSGGGGLRALGEIGNRIVDFGAQGVTVFFVISGYSVAMSYSKSYGYWDYLNKRPWRIAPLYYFWISIAIITGVTATYWQKEFESSVDVYNIFMHLSFLSFLDYKITSTILGVEWTIPIEVFWYLLIPFCMQWMVSRRQLIIAVFLAFIGYIFVVKTPTIFGVAPKDAVIAMHWNPIPYVLAFFLGIVAFRLRESGTNFARWGNIAISVSIMILALVIYSIGHSSKFVYVYISLQTFIFILFGSSSNQLYRWLFTNKIVVYLGSISYGIYLCHLPLLTLLTRFNLVSVDGGPWKFLILSVSAVVVSSLTYFLIERPSQLLGKILYTKYKHLRSLPI